METHLPPIAPPVRRLRLGDDTAYFLPMAVFLGFVWVGGQWKSLYTPAYISRAVIVAMLLWSFRRYYTRIKWNHWWLGIIAGILGIFQWIGMQLWLQHHFEFFKPAKDFFNPETTFPNPAAFWSFVSIRLAGAVLVVPFMEELFWRDYLWRYIIAPNHFKLAEVGERDWKALLLVSGAFAFVHGNWWLTAVVWALMVGLLLYRTGSLGACIIAHGVTNLLLAIYVLTTHDWSFW